MANEVRIVNASGKRLAILENAFGVGYEISTNRLATAWFSLPANDPKVEFCQPLSYVEIIENGQRVELFRILPSELTKGETSVIRYDCEHVLATLIDDVMFRYHEIGGTGIFTTAVINYVLSKQTVTRWVLDVNQFSRQFLYKWENENLLGSLFSIPNRFLEPYEWTYDTTVYPWKLSLKKVSTTPKSYVRYRKNLLGIRKNVDSTQLCTRLYPLGYGEGVNQLDIKSVNNNLPYLTGSTVGQYGIISRIWVDRRFEDAQSLKETAQAMLNELQTPYTTYEIEAADISEITDDSVDKFVPGTYTRVIDEEIGEDIQAPILTVRKDDLDDVATTQIIIANKPLDVAQSIADLADRQRINEVYSQGATNLDSKDFSDNCDPSNPATIEFFIPEETVRINKMELNMRTEAFRAFSKAVGGGGVTGLTSSTTVATINTSSDGGGGGATSDNREVEINTSSDGGGTSTSSAPGTWSLSPTQFLPADFMDLAGDPPHSHSMYSVKHNHSVTIPDHQHTVTSSQHQHEFTIPDHQHTVTSEEHDHDFTIPDHLHDIEYGIFQSFDLPTQITLKVDGNTVPGTDLNRNQLNIIPYLAKDGGGRILRGWHTITATPNNLARIVISMTSQIFVQSRGGGNF